MNVKFAEEAIPNTYLNVIDRKYIDALVQLRGNSSALAMELRLSCTNPSTWRYHDMEKLSAVPTLCKGNPLANGQH